MKPGIAWNQLKQALAGDNFRHYGPNTAWMLAERSLRIASSFLVGIYVARRLGPYQYGVLAYVLGLMAIFAPMANLGMDPLIVKALVREPGQRDRILGSAFGLRAAGVGVMYALLAMTAFRVTTNPETTKMILIVGLSAMHIPFQVIECHFQALVRIRLSVLAQMAQCLLVAALTWWGASRGLPLRFFAWVEAVAALVLLTGWLIGYASAGNRITLWRFDRNRAANLLRATLPLAVAGLLYMFYTRADHILIEKFLGPRALGWYAVPVRLVESCFILPVIIANSVFPGIIQASLRSVEIYEKRLRQLYFFVGWVMAGAALTLILLRHPLVNTLYGEAYAPAANILCIYAWNAVSAGILAILVKWLVNEGHFGMCLAGYAAGLLLNLALLLVTIKPMGLMGAAMASLVALPLGMVLVLSLRPEGRRHLALIGRSMVSLPHG
ncbi:MAG: flippase [Holophaga sp.]|nr:flippase [Holophaga sp.]